METLAIQSGYKINNHHNDEPQMSSPTIPMIVKVVCDGSYTDVPVTPETTCSDVIECCRDPGDECCDLIAVCPEYGECQLRETDHPLEILQRWGSGRLVLRYTMLSSDGRTYEKRNGMKEPDHFGETLPDGVQLTLSELREMACRQQAQIDSQHQLLAAKEQRLRYLKEQEARQQRVQAESERLRRLRDRVDAQELKLRKLRALRGQVDHQKQNNISLTSDLDSIRALFNEKEKELSLAVAKVEELTRQLEELRRGRNGTATPASNRDQHSSTTSVLELDKLRRELMYRNKLNEQQNQRLNQQREALTARQEEMSAIDKRISELQERLHKKRLLNQQLANQISAASHKAAYHQLVRLTGNDIRKQQLNNTHHQPPNGLSRGNIAAVEPYNHLPLRTPQSQSQQQQQQQLQIKQESTYHPVYQSPTITNQQQHIKKDAENNEDLLSNKITNSYQQQQQQQQQQEFTVSKSDPKYQTLPYNTKFTVNLIPNRIIRNSDNDNNNNNTNELVNNNNDNNKENIGNISPTTTSMTVHSAPLNIANKNIATPLNHQNDLIINNNNKTTITTTTTYQKPISSVAPTSIQHSNILSNIYQTSSIKIQPVEPQTTTSNNNNNSSKVQSPSLSLPLSPPNGTSTPLNNTGEISIEKPALPPKPVIKPPPRQTINNVDESLQQQQPPPPLPLTEPPDDTKLRQQQEMVIKAKPLTIKKQQQCEQPKLRSNLKLNQSRFNFGEQLQQQQQQSNDDNSDKVDKKSSPSSSCDEIDKIDDAITTTIPAVTVQQSIKESSTSSSSSSSSPSLSPSRRCLINNNNNNNGNKKGNLKNNKTTSSTAISRRVSFDPLALLLDASLEGELELVKKTAQQVPNPSAANDEGITALHNAICAGHLDIVQYLVNFGCDVNAQDSDGWTPLHCAASCNNVAMVKFLVEHGACIFATTLSDHETAAEKCEEDEEGFDGCSEYLYSVQEKLGILSGGVVYAVFDYTAQQPDELSFKAGQQLTVLRKGDENEREWWWSRLGDKEGYVPRNLLGLYPRVNRKEDDKD